MIEQKGTQKKNRLSFLDSFLEGEPVWKSEILAGFFLAIAAIVYLALMYGPQILRTLGGA